MLEQLKIALVQTSIVWENPEQNRTNLLAKINTISSDVDLIVLPEMFTSGFTMTPENLSDSEGNITLEWMQKLAKLKNAAIVGSIPYFENNSHTNRLFFITPEGQTNVYDKKHTFTLAGEDKVYKSGDKRLVVDYKGFRICPMICYDLRFPVWARYKDDYHILLYVANWPEPRIAAWDTLLKARAIENMAYCVGVNRIGEDKNLLKYPGHTAVYDSLGEQVAFSTIEEIIYCSIDKQQILQSRNKLMFLDDRDRFNLV
ncbi:nitrilase family protein [Aurantibacter crassamenti]|uniref:nitrilase family protein n=1 Tax=Aurantibacter crassamenti TaxID=1837375 RepID=UPI0019394FC1|nr:nitrilase family protein [Aurantibacter crassamenti]MBM1104890.1 nitrilase family protein [Aurantibacter crassamenti]